MEIFFSSLLPLPFRALSVNYVDLESLYNEAKNELEEKRNARGRQSERRIWVGIKCGGWWEQGTVNKQT